jgi:cyclohexanone monooxygenase
MLTGPQTPAVMGTVTISIEQHIEFLGDLLEHVRAHEIEVVDVTTADQDAWVTEVQDLVAGTLLAKHDSWHMGSNVPGKPRTILTYAGGVGTYRKRMNDVREAGYPGFVFSAARQLAGAGGAAE